MQKEDAGSKQESAGTPRVAVVRIVHVNRRRNPYNSPGVEETPAGKIVSVNQPTDTPEKCPARLPEDFYSSEKD